MLDLLSTQIFIFKLIKIIKRYTCSTSICDVEKITQNCAQCLGK